MTTIILVTIGILLAAVAAIFMIFYGGDAFNGGSVGAKAATLENAATNVTSSSDGYRSQNGGLPSSLDDLKGTGDTQWLAQMDIQMRNAASGAGEITDVDGKRVYRVTGVLDEDICKRINHDYSHTADVPTSMGSRVRGCFSDSGNLTFFVVLGGGGSGSATPQMPAAPADPNDDQQMSAYIHALGQFIYSKQSQNPVVASSLAALGIDPAQIHLGSGGSLNNGSGFTSYAGHNVFAIRIPKRSVCQALHQQAGETWDVGEGWALNYHGADPEGCGWQYNFDQSDLYWVNLDDAAAGAQAAAAAALKKHVEDVYMANGALVRGKTQQLGYIPSTTSQLGISLDYESFGGDSGIESPYNGYPVYQRAYIGNAYEDVCRSINVRGGGSANVGRFGDGGDRGMRLFGCGGGYGDMYVWTRIDDVVTSRQANLLQTQMTNAVNAASGYTGDQNSPSYATLQTTLSAEGQVAWASRTQVGNISGGGHVIYRTLNFASICAYINGGASVPTADFDNQPSGCARGYDGNYYYWRRI